MIDRTEPSSTDSRVTAVFADCAVSFSLRRTATLEELAEKLSRFRDAQGGSPMTINVRVGG